MKTSFLRSVVLVICAAFVAVVLARPRPPGVPFPELESKGWRFDIPECVTAEGMGAHIVTNILLVESC